MVLPPEITIVETLISGHHCRKFCLLIRGSCFLDGCFILIIFQSQEGCWGPVIRQKAFQNMKKGFLGDIAKTKQQMLKY